MARETFHPALENIRMSPIVSISEEVRERAKEFEKGGRKLLKFQRGEIDFPTPAYIVEAAKQALDAGRTGYPTSGGEARLKDAILGKLERKYGITDLGRENVVVTHGGQEGLELSFKLFAGGRGAGFSPTWSCALEDFVPYAEVEFAGVPLKADFSVDHDRLDAATREADFFYLNNPQNPTGKVFTREELERVVATCRKNDCFVISDEAYEELVYDDLEHHSLTTFPGEDIVSVFTFSKAFSMTGWRIGYAVTRNRHVADLLRLGDYTQTAGIATFMQDAAAVALENHAEAERAFAPMKEEFAARRDLLYEGLAGLPGIELSKPGGAFYVFPNFTKVIPEDLEGERREKYVYELLMEHGIASVYGSCFGRHFADNVRLSFSTTSRADIEDAVSRFRAIFA